MTAGGPIVQGSVSRVEGRTRLLAIVVLMSLFYLAGLVYYTTVRPIDGDEGFYSTAARLVWEGKVPYRDFFFQQAPLLPYLYSWIWAIHPQSLVSMRLLSAFCGATAVLLWGLCLVSAGRLPQRVTLMTFLVLLLNPYWVSWNVVVKTFALTNLFMSVTTICFYVALRTQRAKWYFAAGLALGICASVRALYGPLIPAVLVWTIAQNWKTCKTSYPRILALLGGAMCGLLPMLRSFVGDPRAFVFNNIRYHGLDVGYMTWNGKLIEGYISLGHTLSVYFSRLVGALLGHHPYFTTEIILAIVGGLSLLKLRSRQNGTYTPQDFSYFQLALVMLVTYTATALIPFPPYDQYFDSPLVPFLIPFVAEGLRIVFVSGKKWGIVLAVLVLFMFRFEIGVENSVNSTGSFWQMSSYREVSNVIEANSAPDDIVLSFWPGNVFESGRRYFPGMEDHFTYRMMNKLSPAERIQYHIVSNEDVMRAITTRAVKVIVIHPWINEYYHALSPEQIQKFQTALDANYFLVKRFEPKLVVYRVRPVAPGLNGIAD